MLKTIGKMFGLVPPEPAGPPRKLGAVGRETAAVSEAARWEGNELRIGATAAETIRLLEIPVETKDQCRLECRFQLRSEDVAGDVYPEMWCRVRGMGECFSKGLQYKLRGTNNWISCELPFYLKQNQYIEHVKLNLVFSGEGRAAIRDIELFETPLSA
jgi:hypothetical protein